MNVLALLLAIALLPVLAIAQPTPAPPLSNDNYADATILEGTYLEGSVALTNATLELQEPLAESWPSRTAWYSWRAPTNGIVNFSAVGTVVGKIYSAFYYGEWPNLRLITSGSGPNVTLRFPVASQQRISIQLGGHPADCCGTYSQAALWSLALQTEGSILEGLRINTVATMEADEFRHAIPLAGDQVSAISYPLWEEHPPLRPDEAGFNSSWYSWTAPHDGKVTVKCITPWPFLQYGSNPLDKKIFGVFTGADPANLTLIATAGGKGDIVGSFKAIGGQTYRISAGKQTTDAFINWIVTTIALEPQPQRPVSIERAVRLRIQTEKGKRYQAQVTQDLQNWTNLGDRVDGTGEPIWVYEPTVSLKEGLYRVQVQD